jgi:hypothetical protein
VNASRHTPAVTQGWRTDVLHVLTLSAFAVAQPLFDLLGRGASFFAAHRAGAGDVVLLALCAVLVVPAFLLAVRGIASAISPSAGRAVHLASIGGLVALAAVPPLVQGMRLSWPVALLVAAAVAASVAVAYRRWRGLRRFVTFVSPAVIAFPVLFLFVSPVRQVILPRAATRAAAGLVPGAKRPTTPVVMALFDELALSNIVTPHGGIDANRYPNFADLAERSTWYPQATTVAMRTDQAVPAILTGVRTARREVPTSFTYPENVFTLLSQTHEVRGREFVTQLCPPDLCSGSDRGTSGLRPLFTDAMVVYLHIVMPADLAARWLPPLGDRWAGFGDEDGERRPEDTGGSDPVRSWLRSALVERRDEHEGDQFSSFLRDALEPAGGKPPFSYMHVQLPHPPWRYLPNGQTYPTGGTTPGYRDFRWSSNQYVTDLVLQRSMLQTEYADVLLGRLIERLDNEGIWDETLVIVTSDHGATWEASGTRREFEEGHAAELLSVPIFVKYPGQERGRIDRRNAETIDIVPTIADVLGVEVPWKVHGSSLRTSTRDGKRAFDGERIRSIDVSFSDVRRRAAQLVDMFGDGRDPVTDLYAFGEHRDVIGRRVADLDVASSGSELRVSLDDPDAYDDVDMHERSIPTLFRAHVRGAGASGRRVAVALDGTIAGAGEVFTDDDQTRIYLMLSPHLMKQGRNEVEVYLVDGRRLVPVRMS